MDGLSPETGARLEHLVPGAVVEGIVPGGPVTVVQAAWHGTTAVTLTYRDSAGRVGEQLVYRNEEPGLRVGSGGRAWAFDADGALFRLASEGRRLALAHLFDPLLAVHLSIVDPLPHQLTAVYRELLPRMPLRFCLADDPGAGKTIMAGLYMKQLRLRGDLARCLVVAPGGLVTQWQDELHEKFGLDFHILTREDVTTSRTGDPFEGHPLCIARLDQLSRSDDIQARLASTDWDLIVVDEAHRMAAHWFGGEVTETRRYKLGRLLGSVCRNFLLMTATPHAGKEEDFQLFMALLDADRFEGRFRDGVHTVDTSDLMRRMVKEKLLRFDGRPLFPERRSYTVAFPLSPAEQVLYDDVTAYVTEEMNRADRLAESGEGRRGNRVGFALTILQRRLASSPEAILQSLVRRRKRLGTELAALHQQLPGSTPAAGDDYDLDDLEDLAADELESAEELLVDSASAARTAAELEAEIATLDRLEQLARRVRASGTDRKWNEFSAVLDETGEMRYPDGSRRKLIVFSEHRDTLDYLCERLRDRLGRPDAVVAIHGGTGREERRAVVERFTTDGDCVVLVATDAAGEGLNLQVAHLVVNYDMPWNPNRIEQRFGRVHRIGQHEVCHLWNLVAAGTREGQVYQRLLEKLEEQRKALGGQVFDVLGQAFEGTPLRDLLLRAIRYGDDPATRAQLDQVIDARIGDGLAELVREHDLSADALTLADVEAERIALEEAEARRLQPHYTRAWTLEALRVLGGRSAEREPRRYEITHVPADVRARDHQIGEGAPVPSRYHRVCFEPADTVLAGRPPAELLAPGHPLVGALIDLVGERYGGLLRQGALLVDDTDQGDVPRALAYLEHAVADGRAASPGGGGRVVSRRFEFVVLTPDGEAATTGAAPYLDLRPATPEEAAGVGAAGILDGEWLGTGLGERAMDVAIGRSVPAHLAEVRRRTDERVRKTREAVHARLTAEIAYWDQRASDLELQAAAGRQPRMNPDRARARADDLARRLQARMAELDAEASLRALPPTVVGGALVVPAGMLGPAGATPPLHARDTTITERRAVDAVMAAEEVLGRAAEEMPHSNPGFDIRSITADGHVLFLEVKGRVTGATAVTITCNEVLHALNSPDHWILALVEVSPDGTDEVRYLRHPFGRGEPTFLFAEHSRNFDWPKLWAAASAPS